MARMTTSIRSENTANTTNPDMKLPVCCLDWPIKAGMVPPPKAPISPIMDPATAVEVGQRSGTS